MQNWIQNLEKINFGSGKYSESYQDKLIDYVFKNISSINSPPFCIEFGYLSDSLFKDSYANTTSLIFDQGWNHLLLDSENENPNINLYKHFLTSDNICNIFKRYNVPSIPDYISIDIDSTDLWIFEKIVKNYKASLISVEYNCNFPLDVAITLKNTLEFKNKNDRCFGASLKALNMVAEENDYLLLWVVEECDAFFIRKDLINDNTNLLTFPFDKWEKSTNVPAMSPVKDKTRLKQFIDYQVYLNSDKNITRSIESAQGICEKVLLFNFYRELRWIYRIPEKWRRNKKRILKKLLKKNS